MPFGEEMGPSFPGRSSNAYSTGDGVRQKFTGYQKDEESGLDFAEARMYENRHARFTAVDPLLASGNGANPQTFNRYVYVANSPLAYTDPTGLVMDWVFRDGQPTIFDSRVTSQADAEELYGPGAEWAPSNSGIEYTDSNGNRFSLGSNGVWWDGNEVQIAEDQAPQTDSSGSSSGWSCFGLTNVCIANSMSTYTGSLKGWHNFSASIVNAPVETPAVGVPGFYYSAQDLGVQPFVNYYSYNNEIERNNSYRIQGILTAGSLASGGTNAVRGATWVAKVTRTAGTGYESFRAFKAVHGNAPKGYAWHHIVEQSKEGVFGAKKIHNTNNLVLLEHGKGKIHNKISGYYSSKQPFTGGKTVRDWLKDKSFDEQHKFGIKVMKQFGWSRE